MPCAQSKYGCNKPSLRSLCLMHIDGSGESFGCPAANDEQLEIAWDAIEGAGPDFRKAGLAVTPDFVQQWSHAD